MKKSVKILVILAIISSISFAAFFWYVSDYYRADEDAIAAFISDVSVEKRELEDGHIAYVPGDYTAGVIFYPGGKVDYMAYEPLMRVLAERGILAVLIKMPYNLAVLSPNAADGVFDIFCGVESWYIAGHSLGGSMAASYAAKNPDKVDGLIMLAAYSTADLTSSGIRVASIYGSLDGVMHREKYEKYITNLPSDFSQTVIEGASHAGFGMYGEQKGDGVSKITNAEQIQITADIIADFVK